jgi:hypothetical protein
MAAYVDPKRVHYPPESLAESQMSGAAVGGTVLARYFNWSPFYVEVERLVSTQNDNTTVIVSGDGYARKMHFHSRGSPAATSSGIHREPTKIIAMDSLEIQLSAETGTAVGTTTLATRWNMTVRDPTIIDKLRLKEAVGAPITFTPGESALITKYDLENRVKLGLHPKNEDLLGTEILRQFDEIKEVSRRVPTIADGDELSIGGELNVPQGKVYTLLGISFDQAQLAAVAAGAITANELWIKVDRDAVRDHMVLDAFSMPEVTAADMLQSVRMFMPATETIDVRLVNDSGGAIASTDNLNIRYIYGIRNMNIPDHIRWNIPFWRESDEDLANALDSKYNISEKISAGILEM